MDTLNTKVAKTYRFNPETLTVIEQRDRKKFPSATDFVEAKILTPSEPVEELLGKIFRELTEVKELLRKEELVSEVKEDPFCF